MIFWVASSRRLGIRGGRIPICIEYSEIRALRLAERTAMSVDPARARVPTAVASDATTVQSAMTGTYRTRSRARRAGGGGVIRTREGWIRPLTAFEAVPFVRSGTPPGRV